VGDGPRINFWYLVLAMPFVIGACVWCAHRPVTHGPGQIAPSAPVQQPADGSRRFGCGEFTVKPLAEFRLTARVLSRRNYSLGRDAKLCPVDLALGWGPMSDERVLARAIPVRPLLHVVLRDLGSQAAVEGQARTCT
jgi:hypothetical protein